MNVKLVARARVSSRNHDRLFLRRKTHVANKSFVQNSVDSLAIEMTALGEPLELRALGLSECHVINMPQISIIRVNRQGEKYALSTIPDRYLSARFNRSRTEWRDRKVSLRRSVLAVGIPQHW